MRPFYKAGDYGMKNSVGYLIRRTANLVLPQLETMFAEDELTFSQWTVLMALREWQASTSAEIARNICHDAGSLTRILDQLEQRGLIARLRSDADRRVVMLTLTPRGGEMVERLIHKVVDFWNSLLGDFSHGEIKTLIKLMSRLVTAAGGEPDTRPRHRQAEHDRLREHRRGRHA
ncbi:MAG TPA: MarR family transcriptional regulator [Rhizomicrobium sp.]|jgi:DNA-binding MarR family transcriptional regulator|nr:MarR family transcriptional regulator [Rhizomicrobium sp.]